MTAGTAWAAEPAPSAAPSSASSAAKAEPPKTITLITGDKVTLRTLPDKQTQLSVEPGPGRGNIDFVHRRTGNGVSVIPVDAMPLLAADRLDARLFDVTGLAALGYDDASSADLPLIVTYPAKARVASFGTPGERPLPAVNGIAVRSPRADAGAFWKTLTPLPQEARLAGGAGKVWLDGKAKQSLSVSVPHIGAPKAWEAGHTGKGVTVAVLDSGYDPDHPDLQGLVIGSKNFTDEADTRDLNGHGTHVAATVAGSGAASEGKAKGVAPGAKLLIGKVCVRTGDCPDSAIIEAMTWAAENGARVANLSLGEADSPGDDPLEQAVNSLSEKYGTLFVVASGNSGVGTVSTPSTADRALSVGASFPDADVVAQFSSTGPRVGDGAVKPDLIAPGVGIIAARAKGTSLGDPVDDYYTSLSGTSMATPHVAGAAAILAGQHPDWKADQIKAALMASTAPGDELGAFIQGTGRVDVAHAIGQKVTTQPTSLSLGEIELPGPGGPVERTLTYRNDGDAPVTLALKVIAKDGHGNEVTPFKLSASTVAVPAHGSADVKVITTLGGTVGMFSGTVIATSGDVSVRTGIGFRLEPEKKALKLSFTGQDGSPAPQAFAGVVDLDTKEQVNYDVSAGKLDLRLIKGHRYTVVSIMAGEDGTLVMAADPEFKLDADRAVTFDVRKSKPVDVRPAEPTARLAFGMTGMLQLIPGEQPLGVDIDLAGMRGGADTTGVRAIPTGRAGSRNFAFYRWTQWAKPKGDGTFDDSPYFYHFMKAEPGRIPADPGYKPKRRELAEVRSTYATQQDGKYGEQWALPVLYGTEMAWMPYGKVSRFTLPFHRTEYYTPGDTGWYPSFIQYKTPPRGWDDVDHYFFGKTRSYDTRTTAERWNFGVIGASLNYQGDFAYRDEYGIQLPMSLFEDGELDRVSYTDYKNEQAALYRDGKQIGSWDYNPFSYQVPADSKAAAYRLTLSAERDSAVTRVSTKVSAEWRFSSATPAAGKRQVLPVMAVKMKPDLDDRNRASVGFMHIPLEIQRQAGAPGARVNKVTVDISYDDGRTWTPTLVLPLLDGTWGAETWHPLSAKGRFASLRVNAADTAGNGFTETVIRAYEIK